MVSKEDFMKVWKDTSRENILSQFYYEHKTLREEFEKWNKLNKYIEEKIKMIEKTQSKAIELKQIKAIGDFNLRLSSYKEIQEKMQELEGNNE